MYARIQHHSIWGHKALCSKCALILIQINTCIKVSFEISIRLYSNDSDSGFVLICARHSSTPTVYLYCIVVDNDTDRALPHCFIKWIAVRWCIHWKVSVHTALTVWRGIHWKLDWVVDIITYYRPLVHRSRIQGLQDWLTALHWNVSKNTQIVL